MVVALSQFFYQFFLHCRNRALHWQTNSKMFSGDSTPEIFRGSEAPSGATSPSEVFLDLPAFNVPDAPSASESIRRSGAEGPYLTAHRIKTGVLLLNSSSRRS